LKSLVKAVFDWRPKTPFYYGWLILGISFLAAFAATGFSQVTLGGIQVFITDDTGWKMSTLALAVTAGTWCSALLAPFIGWLTDRYGPRWLVPVGLITAAVAFFSLSGSHSTWQFFVAYIVGRTVSNPVLINVVSRTTAVNFFRRRRNLVLALVPSYRPIGGAVNIQLITFIALRQSWRRAYSYLGFYGLILVAPMALLMRRRPEDIGLLPDGAKQIEPKAAAVVGVHHPSRGDVEQSWTAREAWHTKAFWLVVLTAGASTLANSSLVFSLVPYLSEEGGISKAQAAGILSLGTFLAITTLGWGWLADQITPRWCLAVAVVACGAASLYLMVVNSMPMALGFTLVFGVFSGALTPLENMVLAHYYGRNSFGAISGLYTLFKVIMLGLGPTVASLFIEVVDSYKLLYISVAGLYFLAGLFISLAGQPALHARAPAEKPAQAV
jgi:MFS family permease